MRRRYAANIIFDRIFLSYNIYLPEIEKVLLKNANFLKKFSFGILTWHETTHNFRKTFYVYGYGINY